MQSEFIKALATRMVVALAQTTLPLGSVPRPLCPMEAVGAQSLMLDPYAAAPLDKRHFKYKLACLRH